MQDRPYSLGVVVRVQHVSHQLLLQDRLTFDHERALLGEQVLLAPVLVLALLVVQGQVLRMLELQFSALVLVQGVAPRYQQA